MKSLPASLLTLLACVVLTGSAFAKEWQTNYKDALATAAQENKNVLLDFTGSDWCPWCIKLDKDTYDTPQFKAFAADNLVLVKLDYPRSAPQTEAVKKQNEQLSDQYGIQGFPTQVLLNPQGKEILRNVGYLAGGPTAFIAWVKSAK